MVLPLLIVEVSFIDPLGPCYILRLEVLNFVVVLLTSMLLRMTRIASNLDLYTLCHVHPHASAYIPSYVPLLSWVSLLII